MPSEFKQVEEEEEEVSSVKAMNSKTSQEAIVN